MKKKSMSFKIALTFIIGVMSVFLLFGCAHANNKAGLQLTLKANIDSATVFGGGYYQKNDDVSISVNTPDGYKFLGWYYDQDLISTSAKYNLKMWDKDVTLDAKFVANITYGDSDGSSSSLYGLTVKSNSRKNGDISVNASNLNIGNVHKYEKDFTIGYNIKVTAVTKTSIRFLGWYDGIDTLLMPNASFEFMMPSTDFILIAKWEEGDEIIKNIEYEEQDDGTYAVTGVSDKDAEKLTIESNINGKTVSLIEKAAFVNCKNLKTISIPASIQKIGDRAFSGCRKLTNISIPNDEILIGNNTFKGCPIETASVPTSLILYIPKQKLKTLIITGGTAIDSNALYDCDRLTSVTIPDSVTSIGDSAFEGCSRLTSVTIGKKVSYIGESAFKECCRLVEVINNSDLNIKKGESDKGYVAYYALEVKENGTTDIVNENDYLFYVYNNINYLLGYVGQEIELALPNDYNGESYEIYGYAFYDCIGLESIIIPDGVTSIGAVAFYNCIKLTSVTIPDSVTYIGNFAFYGCIGLESITIPDSVTYIGFGAFYSCSGLESITIPDSVTYIGSSAFEGCSGLETVYYKGTAAEWNKISIDNNGNLTSATRYYYSETKPTESGNYWHYDADGVTPVIWGKEN